MLILTGNLMLIVWTSSQLSEAREFQQRFNNLRQQDGGAAAGAEAE